MHGEIGDETLWSWVDRDAAELEAHLARRPEDRARVEALRDAIAGIAGAGEPPIPAAVGRYRILGLLGQGGMGVVYEAEQESPRRRVALKVVRGGARADRSRIALFEREARALARLAHAGIATIHDAGTTVEGEPYFAMELARGLPLQRWIRERAPSRPERIEVMRRICSAVRHAHERGVVHCDLKPSNVVVDEAGAPKVLDFGLARIVDETASERSLSTAAGRIAGTLPYASPEQALGLRARVDAASDVYSLGCMLYELLTGVLPRDLAGKTVLESVRAIDEEPPPRPSRVDPSLRGDLEAIVLKALDREPARRYADAGALGDDLARHLAGLPVVARRTTLVGRAWRRLRRRKVAATIAAALCLLGGTAAWAIAFPTNLPWPLGGDWWRTGVPWQELRWRGDVPEVRVGGRWHELLAIDGLRADYVVGFAKQHADERWRKRFSEDLVQVLNRMGDPCIASVDLRLRDLETGRASDLEGVPLDADARREIVRDRGEWPFELAPAEGDDVLCAWSGRMWILEGVDGFPTAALTGRQRSLRVSLYDAICDLAGRSPGTRISIALRDPDTGERREVADVARVAERAGLAEAGWWSDARWAALRR